MAITKEYLKTDYGKPENRTFKIPIDGDIKGYDFDRMTKWIKKWDDPSSTIRRSRQYTELYKKHYKNLMEYIPQKCITKLKVEEKKRNEEVNRLRSRYLKNGLTQCIEMFEKIQNKMEPDDPFRKSFSWETKVLFFSYYDLCMAKNKQK